MGLLDDSFFSNLFKIFRRRNDLIQIKIHNRKIPIDFSEINKFPEEILEIKEDIINIELKRIKLEKSFKKHLFNIFFLFRDEFHKKACLIDLLKAKNTKIQKITASFLSRKDISLFQKYQINIGKIAQNYIDSPSSPLKIFFGTIRLLQFRYIQHKRNRNLLPESLSRYDPSLKYKIMVRIWEEFADKVFLEKLKGDTRTSIVHVNLLTIQPTRSYIYLREMIKNKRPFFIHIPPPINLKVIKKAFLTIFYPYPNELKLLLVEMLIQRNEMEEMVNHIIHRFPSIETIYTMDEWDAPAIYFTEMVHKHQIQIIDLSHGVGVYSPYVDYDTFFVYSTLQRDYYRSLCKFEIYPFIIQKQNQETRLGRKLALFIIGQTIFSLYPQQHLRKSYQKFVQFAEDIATQTSIPVFGKYHPSSKQEDLIFSKKIQIVKNVEDLPSEYNYLALTLHSAYAIELIGKMPFIAINPNGILNNFKYIFPERSDFVVENYPNLLNKINEINSDFKNYQAFWDQQVKTLSSIYNLQIHREKS